MLGVLNLIQGSGHTKLAYPTIYLQGMKLKKLTKYVVPKVQKGVHHKEVNFFNFHLGECLTKHVHLCILIVVSMKSRDAAISFHQFKFLPIGKFSLFAKTSLCQIF